MVAVAAIVNEVNICADFHMIPKRKLKHVHIAKSGAGWSLARGKKEHMALCRKLLNFAR